MGVDVGRAVARERLAGLDALRGMGACLVLLLHLHFESGGLAIFKRSYLAVDLFFLLSGFVFSGAYDARLRSRALTPFHFLRSRIVRLYPTIAFGLILGAANLYLRNAGWREVTVGLVCQALLLPTLQHGSVLFPLNTPQWSLFFEVIANAAYAFTSRLLSTPVLIAVTAVSAILYAVMIVLAGGADIGAMKANLAGGLVRVSFGFSAGLLLGRLWSAASVGGRGPGGSVALLAFPLSVLMAEWSGANTALVDACLIFGLFPLILWLAASVRLGKRGEAVATVAGDLSYPLYAIHVPLLGLTSLLIREWRPGVYGTALLWIASVALIVALAWCFGEAERAVRRGVRERRRPLGRPHSLATLT